MLVRVYERERWGEGVKQMFYRYSLPSGMLNGVQESILDCPILFFMSNKDTRRQGVGRIDAVVRVVLTVVMCCWSWWLRCC